MKEINAICIFQIGIQHDAEEFLSKILMICHEELENVMKLNQVPGTFLFKHVVHQ